MDAAPDVIADRHRRQAELVSRLGAVRARVAQACDSAGRDPRGVTLIAVTKTWPVSDVATLVRLGERDLGEAKDQEARAKVAELDDASVRWHLVGRLQTNKATSVARYAFSVHSVDRPKLARALADACQGRRQSPLEVFCQVSLDDDPKRGGAPESEVSRLADLIAAREELALRGVMAVAPVELDPERAFEKLATISARLRENHPAADAISAGMSNDLEAALQHGSTHLRVGSALLGRREPTFS